LYCYVEGQSGHLTNTLVDCAGDESTDGTSIVDGIVEVLKKAPLDVRTAMLENLLFVGGTAMIPGKLAGWLFSSSCALTRLRD
jgi:hypothetical protein